MLVAVAGMVRLALPPKALLLLPENSPRALLLAVVLVLVLVRLLLLLLLVRGAKGLLLEMAEEAVVRGAAIAEDPGPENTPLELEGVRPFPAPKIRLGAVPPNKKEEEEEGAGAERPELELELLPKTTGAAAVVEGTGAAVELVEKETAKGLEAVEGVVVSLFTAAPPPKTIAAEEAAGGGGGAIVLFAGRLKLAAKEWPAVVAVEAAAIPFEAKAMPKGIVTLLEPPLVGMVGGFPV